jgi:hypothetical protein
MLAHSDRRRNHFAVLAMILIFAAALRIYHLGAISLWEDEYFSVECSSGWGRTDMRLASAQVVPDLISLRNARPIGTIWSSIARDENHPPLYFILLRIWRDMFGDSAVALRSLSVVGSLAGIVLLYFVGEVAIGPGAALWACALMAVAWPQIQEAQDARAYSLLTADALLCLLALMRIQRFGVTPFRIVWLFTAALVMPLLHYMAAATFLAMVVYAAIALRGQKRISVLSCFVGVVVAYFILWGPQLIGQRHLGNFLVDRTEQAPVLGHDEGFGRDLRSLPGGTAREQNDFGHGGDHRSVRSTAAVSADPANAFVVAVAGFPDCHHPADRPVLPSAQPGACEVHACSGAGALSDDRNACRQQKLVGQPDAGVCDIDTGAGDFQLRSLHARSVRFRYAGLAGVRAVCAG